MIRAIGMVLQRLGSLLDMPFSPREVKAAILTECAEILLAEVKKPKRGKQ